ncbi:peptide-N4-(N-acetyl-beta-glucosaminyl)asparagine amidase A [Macadamia integrifolia]|uniref:peptide-N4-(N-acetyl-beta- glucosaminyl)asparagine amidase A n=1 Tax=Macadamia integrifolia TaxID=60698 RepID=UPI001C4EC92D|nr:peptide-N4-(N-acetyl-beta-glucosaminyl)asparagine amidase A [Macadamia integrifolia]
MASLSSSASPSPFGSHAFVFLNFLLLCFVVHQSHSITLLSPLDSSSSSLPGRYFKSLPSSLHLNESTEYYEITLPLKTDKFSPSCSLLLLQHDFGNTYGLPPATASYSPPSDCPAPWSHVVLELQVSCQGEQYDRIVGVWLDGVEILRTSTAEPTDSGIFWKVRKDVTKYSSLLSLSNLTLSVMLENIINDVFTGVYHVNISLLYYGQSGARVHSDSPELFSNRKLGPLIEEGTLGLRSEARKLMFISGEHDGRIRSRTDSTEGQKLGVLSRKPADLIVPIASDGSDGFWFRIENEFDVHLKRIQIPPNTYRAILEIYVSFHGNDEFWYSNPPDAYIKLNNLTTGRGNGAFRQVFVTIDGVLVGSQALFPVIFTGGINPLFWEPVVAIGAFNLPSYDIDLTPFLGLLLDGKDHSFGLGVSDGISFWLVDANLHFWLDPKLSTVQAKSVVYRIPPLSVNRDSKYDKLDGTFKVKAKTETHCSGWVKSTAGNFTTHVFQEFKFKNSIKYKKNGTYKEVEQKIKMKTDVRLETDEQRLLSRLVYKRTYPLRIITSTIPGFDINTNLLFTNVTNGFKEKYSMADYITSISNTQRSGGWMLVHDHSVLSGSAETRQTLRYKDDFTCYSRNVASNNGSVMEDYTTNACDLLS